MTVTRHGCSKPCFASSIQGGGRRSKCPFCGRREASSIAFWTTTPVRMLSRSKRSRTSAVSSSSCDGPPRRRIHFLRRRCGRSSRPIPDGGRTSDASCSCGPRMPADRSLATSAGSSPRPIRRTHGRSGLPSQRRTHRGRAMASCGSAFAATRPTSSIDVPLEYQAEAGRTSTLIRRGRRRCSLRPNETRREGHPGPMERTFVSVAVRLERTGGAAARRDGTFMHLFVRCGRTRTRRHARAVLHRSRNGTGPSGAVDA